MSRHALTAWQTLVAQARRAGRQVLVPGGAGRVGNDAGQSQHPWAAWGMMIGAGLLRVRRASCLLATPRDAAPGRKRGARTTMIEQKPLTGPARRRRMVRALGRALLSTLLLIVLYYLLPLDRALNAGAITVLVFGLLVLVGLVGWQIRAILRADYPALRAVEGLAVTIPLFLLLFAVVYFVMAHAQSAAFTQPLSRTDALYFTVTVFATVGFGDIAANTACPGRRHGADGRRPAGARGAAEGGGRRRPDRSAAADGGHNAAERRHPGGRTARQSCLP